MNNMQDQEKDLFIRKKLREDELVSKKYDDVFENFLKGDHEMKEEQKMEQKGESTKKQKKSWVKPFAAVAACALIFTGANVYATTQGYDNIFFLIKDLGNKNKQVTATKDEILSDRDITISYTNIEIADGLFIQINRFVVKEGKAFLFVTVNQEEAKVSPDQFIVLSNGETLANEKIVDENQESLSIAYDEKDVPRTTQYSYEIKLGNNYKDSMKVLSLRVEDSKASEIATIEIDLENREIDLLASDSAEEVKKISEVDLKQKLGTYAIGLKPYSTEKTLDDDDKFFLAINLVADAEAGSGKLTDDGYMAYSRESINQALKEAIGEELSTNIESELFKYNSSLDSYQFIVAGDMITSGLCLNIDDLSYENGKYSVTFTYCMPDEQDYTNGAIETLDRFQATLEFTLNENESYTKYQVLNMNEIESEKIEAEKPSEESSAKPVVSEHTHNYSIVKAEQTGEYHTTIDGTHTLRCTICGEEKQEPHRFGKWWTIYNGTAWTLWCEDCNQYIYTSDYNFVQNHLEYGMNPVETEDTSTNKPTYDSSTVNNYASTMDWSEYWAPGIKFQYPTDWEFSANSRDGGKGILVNAEATGWAIGINKETNEIIESYTTIEVYDQVVVSGNSQEEALQNFANEYRFKANGCYYTNNNGDEWYEFLDDSQMYDEIAGDTYYVHASEVWDGGAPNGKYVIDIVRILTSNKNNFKVTNITNYVVGNLKLTSK